MAIIKKTLGNRVDIIEKKFREHFSDGLGGLAYDAFFAGWKEAWLECTTQLQAENKDLRKDLLEFGRHSEGCNRSYNEKYSCRCGWLEIESALEGGKT